MYFVEKKPVYRTVTINITIVYLHTVFGVSLFDCVFLVTSLIYCISSKEHGAPARLSVRKQTPNNSS